MAKFGIEYYNVPTPKILKVVGDSLLAASATITSGTLFSALGNLQHPEQAAMLIKVGIVSTIVGAVGKFLSKLFGDLEKIENKN